MNDKTFLPFLRLYPSQLIKPRGTAVRIAQRPEPAFHQPVSPELGGITFKRQGDEPRAHLAHVHRPFDLTCFAFPETIGKEPMTGWELFPTWTI